MENIFPLNPTCTTHTYMHEALLFETHETQQQYLNIISKTYYIDYCNDKESHGKVLTYM